MKLISCAGPPMAENKRSVIHPKTFFIMRLIIFLTILSCLKVSANVYAQQISINVKNAPVEAVLKDIKKQSGYSLIAEDHLLDNVRGVSLILKNVSIQKALDECFKEQSLTYQIVGKTILIKRKPQPQKTKVIPPTGIQIKGMVTDTAGEPIQGAVIKVKGKNIAAITNGDGSFEIKDVSMDATLIISSIGYKTESVPVSDIPDSFLKVSLKFNVTSLSQVSIVSTGYQQLPKERATGSFSKVDNVLLNRQVSTNIIDRLEGNVPGLLFNKNTANSVNGNNDINIRGHSTLFANDQPLIVLDNFPYDGDLANINPSDVESITILKDAAASSIWGVRSGNGVIVITTKKGKRTQDLKIEFNANVTIGSRPNLYYKGNSQINSSDIIDIEKKLFKQGYYDSDLNNSAYPAISPVVNLLNKIKNNQLDSISGYNQINAMRGNDVRQDLQKYFYQKSINQQYALNFQGGGEKSDYYFSLGYDKNRSNKVGNDNNRINLSTRLNFYPTKKLNFQVGVNYTQTNSSGNTTLNDLSRLNVPTYSDLVDNKTGKALALSRRNPDYIDTVGAGKFLDWNYRPYDELSFSDNQTKQIHDLIKLGANYKIIEGLTVSANYQYEYANTNSNNNNTLSTYYARDLINRYRDLSNANPYPVPVGGILNRTQDQLIGHRGRLQLDYNKDFGQDHRLVVLLGSEISQTITESNSNTLYGYNKDTETFTNVDFATSYPTNPGGAGVIPNINNIAKYTDRYLSYFANGSYTFKDRYIFSLSGRIDKSNLFGVNTNQKAVPLYSTGLAWNFSKEDFYHSEILPYGKLRVTYGYNGNIDKSATAVTTFATNNNSPYYGTPFADIANPGNPELRWEKDRIINFGIDFGFKNNILSGSIEYYLKNGIDLFGNSPLPGSTGLTAFYGNTANTQTHGFDINLNSINIKSEKFLWVSNLQVSRALDIVTKYNAPTTSLNYLSGMRAEIIQPLQGKPLFAIYSFRAAGLTHETGDPQGYLNGVLSTDYANIISSTTVNDMVYNGPARPTVFGSFRNTFSYKKLSLSFNIIYKFDYYFRAPVYTSSGLYAGGASLDYYQRWQKPGDETKTKIPSLQSLPIDNNRETFYTLSDTFIEKGDHIRLQDASLQYDINLKSKKKGMITGLQVYGYANNIVILWRANKSGIDPDVYSNGYANPRTISLGIKAKF
ncbi:SusC/RagA family TonB-linked outer membrane protein [Mucilaginibacter pineti]|nr:SusC/RagA family TonB-linked outer membrane protein [Mucilaginibacter pineti]